MSAESKLMDAFVQNLRTAVKLSLDLFKIMIPIIIVVKILKELDLIKYLAVPLGPFMKAVGLPNEMGLVWATAMLNNLYGAIVVFLSLVKETPVTSAQATVLCTMMLVAHTLPIELKIAQASGTRVLFQVVSRIGSAILLGWLLNTSYKCLGILQNPAGIAFNPRVDTALQEESLLTWAVSQIRNLFSIFLIILGLFLLMQVLKKLRVIEFMNRALRYPLKLMGIGEKASAITVIGLTMGITYGGGLIIHEAGSGRIEKKDVFYSLTLMGLSHALIEDTLLMATIGGHSSGILFARVVFSVLAVAFFVKISSRLPAAFSDRFLWGNPKIPGLGI